MPKDIDSKLIITKFAMKGYNVHPLAVETLKREAANLNLDQLISRICAVSNDSFIITQEDVLSTIRSVAETKKVEKVEPKEIEQCEISILKDVTGNSCCEGNIENFIAYFNSRYEKLSRILRARLNASPIASLRRAERVEVIGMVSGVRESSVGNIVIELEDKTGKINVIASGKLKDIAMELLGDEVIGVMGTLRGKIIMADKIFFPDIPVNGRRIKKDFSIVFISDTHFGSKAFLQKEWELFVKWLNCEAEMKSTAELAESVKYVVIAGDVVDGIAIYPNQEEELAILDIYEQYEEAASQLEKIPKNIKIILSPGNHDAIRQAEPQPALPNDYASLFSNNIINVGNPAMVDVEGVKLLVYHGRSFDDLVTKISRLSYSKPQELMEELLKRRHLSPMYGGKSPLAPEKEDYLVIEEVPDVIHTGHIHTYGTSFYKGVLLVNSSCWQTQTDYQVKRGIEPMPGNVAVYSGGEVYRLRFYRGG